VRPFQEKMFKGGEEKRKNEKRRQTGSMSETQSSWSWVESALTHQAPVKIQRAPNKKEIIFCRDNNKYY